MTNLNASQVVLVEQVLHGLVSPGIGRRGLEGEQTPRPCGRLERAGRVSVEVGFEQPLRLGLPSEGGGRRRRRPRGARAPRPPGRQRRPTLARPPLQRDVHVLGRRLRRRLYPGPRLFAWRGRILTGARLLLDLLLLGLAGVGLARREPKVGESRQEAADARPGWFGG